MSGGGEEPSGRFVKGGDIGAHIGLGFVAGTGTCIGIREECLEIQSLRWQSSPGAVHDVDVIVHKEISRCK